MKYYLALFLMLAVCVWGAEIVENHEDDVITHFVMTDRTTGLRDTGVTVANLEMYWNKDQGAESADVFVGAHGAATDAHTDGECFHIGHGLYRVDWPDNAFEGGVGTRVHLTLVDGDAGAKTETLVVLLSPPSNVTSIGANVITAAAINNAAIDAATFAADVDAEVAAYVWNYDISAITTSGYAGLYLRNAGGIYGINMEFLGHLASLWLSDINVIYLAQL